jgi:endonuclease/exonuclease/phosphatase family metal-dependent hydrolase
MEMKFSILSWNVEEFNGSAAQLASVADHIRELDPDVFGLFEVENVNIIDLITQELPGYDYSLTDGPQNKEILLGVRRGKFDQAIFSQKRQFKAYNPRLRPGALLSLSIGGEFYNVLFLHTDSGTEAPDFGNRNEMFEKIWSLKNALDKQSPEGTGARFVVLGDLNTMGLQFPSRRKSDTRVSEAGEIEALAGFAKRRGMLLLRKEFPHTFNNGKLVSDLDHVLASDNIPFRELGQVEGEPFHVRVTGWQQLEGDARETFIETISDHCSLYCEVL